MVESYSKIKLIFLCDFLRSKVFFHKQILKMVPTNDEITTIAENAVRELLSGYSSYYNISNDFISLMIRKSNIPRREENILDVDVVQISIAESLRKKGIATRVIRELARIASKHNRGLFIECAITPGSINLVKRLVRNEEAYENRLYMNSAFYVYPSPNN